MTKTKVLKKFFKKFFNYDATGNSSTQVINDFVENNESIPSGGSDIVFLPAEFTNGQITILKTWQEIYDLFQNNSETVYYIKLQFSQNSRVIQELIWVLCIDAIGHIDARADEGEESWYVGLGKNTLTAQSANDYPTGIFVR